MEVEIWSDAVCIFVPPGIGTVLEHLI